MITIKNNNNFNIKIKNVQIDKIFKEYVFKKNSETDVNSLELLALKDNVLFERMLKSELLREKKKTKKNSVVKDVEQSIKDNSES